MRGPSRRRVLAIAAGGLAAAAVSRAAAAGGAVARRFRALGAEAAITLPGEPDRAEAAVTAVVEEVRRIEAVFSLWDAGSEISRLNAAGRLERPDRRFLDLIERADEMARTTDGAFDPTVQVLWTAAAEGGDPASAAGRVGRDGLSADAGRLAFRRPQMALTFNGIAQGFAADAAAAILEGFGYRNVLVDLGEFRALGRAPAGRPWRVGVAAPAGGRVAAVLSPGDGAVATSAPRGTLVRGVPHVFDPLGRPGERFASVTVLADEAWRADALSTAVAAAPARDAADLLARGGAREAVLQAGDGRLARWPG